MILFLKFIFLTHISSLKFSVVLVFFFSRLQTFRSLSNTLLPHIQSNAAAFSDHCHISQLNWVFFSFLLFLNNILSFLRCHDNSSKKIKSLKVTLIVNVVQLINCRVLEDSISIFLLKCYSLHKIVILYRRCIVNLLNTRALEFDIYWADIQLQQFAMQINFGFSPITGNISAQGWPDFSFVH